MITLGAFEAKTHLSMLLDRVARGEQVVITKHGKPIARLIPESVAGRADGDAVIAPRGCRRPTPGGRLFA